MTAFILFFPAWRDATFELMRSQMSDVKPRVYKGPYYEVRNLVSYDTSEEDLISGIDCTVDEFGEFTPSMTKQEFKDECDINQIMKRYEVTGEIRHVNSREGTYGDFTDVKSYHDAQNIVLEANAFFADLPATVRDRFGNDPAKMLAFLEDGKNRDEAIELGLVKRPEPEAPAQKVEIVNPPPPKQDSPPKAATGGPGGAPA